MCVLFWYFNFQYSFGAFFNKEGSAMEFAVEGCAQSLPRLTGKTSMQKLVFVWVEMVFVILIEGRVYT